MPAFSFSVDCNCADRRALAPDVPFVQAPTIEAALVAWANFKYADAKRWLIHVKGKGHLLVGPSERP